MRAVVFAGVGEPLVVEDLVLAPPRAGEVRVRLASSGVCHSDLHVTAGDWEVPTPMVLGHEGAGVVTELGGGVTDLAAGDHVIVNWMPSCGACPQCLRGRPWLCEPAAEMGDAGFMFDGTSRLSRQSGETVYQFLAAGVFAEEAVIPAAGAIKVREDAPLESICIIGCAVATGFGAAANTARVEWGSTVVVIGLGAVGLSVIQGAAHLAARKIIAIDMKPAKLETARRFGATDVIDASRDDPVDAVLESYGGADYVFECVGLAKTAEQAAAMLAHRGTAVIVGQPSTGVTPTYDSLTMSCCEHRIVGCNYGSTRPLVDFPKLVDLYMAGKLMVDELITARRPLAEAQQAFDDLAAGRALRTVLIP